MVYGISFCPMDNITLLDALGCDDSKELTEEKRNKIFAEICKQSEIVGWITEVISPNVISNSMLSRSKVSLNEVSMNSAINLIKICIDKGVNIEHIYVDTVGKPEKYQTYLKSLFPQYKITVAKKADSTYPIVSAASICAKVTRDHALQVWKFPEGIDVKQEQFGSGYPGGYFYTFSFRKSLPYFFLVDPVTKQFLIKYCDPVFGYPQLVRFGWSTAINALKESAYYVEWEDSDEESPSNTTSIMEFFKATKKESRKGARHDFFKTRCLSTTTDL